MRDLDVNDWIQIVFMGVALGIVIWIVVKGPL